MSDLLTEIATWADNLTWVNLPNDVQQRAVAALCDTVATMAGGARTQAASIAANYASRSPGHSPLAVRGASVAAPMAAFANGVAASALDFDDGHYLAGAIHPGSVIIPAVLAAADSQVRVDSALLAQVVGYEIGLRAAALLWQQHENDHYHATGCAGAIGAAAAVAKLRGLDAEGIERAVKLAWVHAPMSTFGLPMVKESIGWGACTGLAAAELAEAGFMANPVAYSIPVNDVLPPSPFHRKNAQNNAFVTTFGDTFECLNTYFKPYACCRYTHAAGAGLLDLMRENGIKGDEIASIRVGTHRGATFLKEAEPRTIETAQYSFPFVLASLALWGSVDARQMDAMRLADPGRLELARRVRVEYDADMDQYYPTRYASRVELTLHSGAIASGVFVDAPGDPGTKFGPAELRAKWLRLLSDALPNGGEAAVLNSLAQPATPLFDALGPVWSDCDVESVKRLPVA